jgi:hypothetical protein
MAYAGLGATSHKINSLRWATTAAARQRLAEAG